MKLRTQFLCCILALGFVKGAALLNGAQPEPNPAATSPIKRSQISAIQLSAAQPVVPLAPWPRSVEMGSGQLLLSDKSHIVIAGASLDPLAKILAEEIDQTCNLRLSIAEGQPGFGDISLTIDPAFKDNTYRLEIDGRNAIVRGSDYNAVAMGTVTLLQSLKLDGGQVAAPVMTVNDGPQSTYCGTMVDVARRYNSIDSLKQIVVMCRLYKIRFLQLHLTDDQAWMVPSKAFPKLGSTPQFLDNKGHAPYTREELVGLVRFADERGVAIVPEIEMPGHSGALQRDLPEIFGVLDPKTGKKHACGVINLANPEIYSALDTIIGEVCEVFKSSPYFHMGSDEVYWPSFLETEDFKQFAKTSGQTTPRRMVAPFAAKINAMVKKRGKRLISWESYGGTIDKDIVIMAWRAGHEDMIKQGYQIINVPWIPQIGYTPRANFEWSVWSVGPEGCTRPTEMPRTPEILKGVLGAQQVLWEHSGDDSLRLLRETAPARNEQVYNPYGARSYDDFRNRMQHTNVLLDKLACPVRISATGLRKIEGVVPADVSQIWGPADPQMLSFGGNTLFNHQLTVTLESLLNQKDPSIRYTIDGSEPTSESTRYTAPFSLAPSVEEVARATNEHQPRIDLTVRARMFVQDKPVGFSRSVTYSYNLLERVPQTWKFSLYELESRPKKIPADLAGLKLMYRGTASTMLLNDMRQFNFPPSFISIWEGTTNVAKDTEFKFRLRSFAGISQLFIDGKLLIDRTTDDWGLDLGAIRLSAGKHSVKVIRCGGVGYQSLNVVFPDESQKPLDLEPLATTPN